MVNCDYDIMYEHFHKLAREQDRETLRAIDFARFYSQITRTGNPAGNSSHFSRRRVRYPGWLACERFIFKLLVSHSKRRNQSRVSRRVCTFVRERDYWKLSILLETFRSEILSLRLLFRYEARRDRTPILRVTSKKIEVFTSVF